MSLNGTRYRDLKDRIKELEQMNRELGEKLKSSICPYCKKVRGKAHGYNRQGEEVACPQFAGFSYPNAYGEYPRDGTD